MLFRSMVFFDPEHAFGAGKQRQQIETWRVECVRAQGQRFAVDGQHLELEQVVDGQAGLQAMHATGVFRDIAAD